jgi:hypothetical protein
MSPFDCDFDSDAPPDLLGHQYSSIELGKLFGCDDPDDPEEQQELRKIYILIST